MKMTRVLLEDLLKKQKYFSLEFLNMMKISIKQHIDGL